MFKFTSCGLDAANAGLGSLNAQYWINNVPVQVAYFQRGFNVFVVDPSQPYATASWTTYDTFQSSASGSSMVTYLSGLRSGLIVAIVCMDECTQSLASTTKTSIAARCGNGINSLAYRDSYLCIYVTGFGTRFTDQQHSNCVTGQIGVPSCAAGTLAYAKSDGSMGCSPCSAGYSAIRGADACSACSTGKFSGSSGLTACSPCAAGTAGSQTGLSACSQCVAGQFSSQGATACASCSAGSYSAAGGSSGCTSCAAGQYSAAAASSCLQCPSGKYSAAGASDCTSCSGGTFSAAGASNCTVCSAGQYSAAAASSCTPCSGGTYSAEGASLCAICAAGTYSGDSATTCTTCVAGQYASAGSSSCSACSPGSISAAGASVCSPCARGTASAISGATVCDTCVAGKFAPAGASQCTSCAAGSYSAQQASDCTSCSAGSFSAAAAATVCSACGVGKFSSSRSSVCTDCAAGTFSLQGAAVCTPCSGGSVSANAGSSVCTSCSAGQYAPAGFTRCVSCSAGMYSAQSASSCIACGGGSYSAAAGATGCAACGVGKYAGSGWSSCSDCPGGSYSGAGATQCSSCGDGSYSLAGSSSCSTCGAGTFAPSSSSTCLTCQAGRYSAAGAGICAPCSGGSYSSTGAMTCAACTAGKYSTDAASTCSSCPGGWYSDKDGMSGCHACSAGKYSEPGASTCTNCTRGFFAEWNGMAACDACPAGSYSSAEGLSGCSECAVGRFSTTVGAADASVCVACSSGTYNTAAGQSLCLSCSIGTYNQAAGLSECFNCPAGTYSVDVGGSALTSCLNCAAGKYSTALAATECSSCDPGTYMNSTGATACLKVPMGYYSNLASATYAEPCRAGTFTEQAGTVQCLACPRPKNCPGGGVSQCPVGTGDLLCGKCQAGYFDINGGCEQCPSTWWLPLVVGVLVFAGASVLIKKGIWNHNFSSVIRNLGTFVQMVHLDFTFHVPWPVFLIQFGRWIESAFGDLGVLYSPQCAIHWSWYQSFWLVIGLCVGLLGIPLYVRVAVILWTKWRNSRAVQQSIRQLKGNTSRSAAQFSATALEAWGTITMLVYLPLIRVLLEPLICIATSNDVKLLADVSLSCRSAGIIAHQVFSVVCLVLLVLVLPIAIVLTVRTLDSRGGLQIHFIGRALQAFYAPYKDSFRYTEVYNMVRKAIGVFMAFVPLGYVQLGVQMGMAFGLWIIVVVYKPWVSTDIKVCSHVFKDVTNKLQVVAVTAELVVGVCGLVAIDRPSEVAKILGYVSSAVMGLALAGYSMLVIRSLIASYTFKKKFNSANKVGCEQLRKWADQGRIDLMTLVAITQRSTAKVQLDMLESQIKDYSANSSLAKNPLELSMLVKSMQAEKQRLTTQLADPRTADRVQRELLPQWTSQLEDAARGVKAAISQPEVDIDLAMKLRTDLLQFVAEYSEELDQLADALIDTVLYANQYADLLPAAKLLNDTVAFVEGERRVVPMDWIESSSLKKDLKKLCHLRAQERKAVADGAIEVAAKALEDGKDTAEKLSRAMDHMVSDAQSKGHFWSVIAAVERRALGRKHILAGWDVPTSLTFGEAANVRTLMTGVLPLDGLVTKEPVSPASPSVVETPRGAETDVTAIQVVVQDDVEQADGKVEAEDDTESKPPASAQAVSSPAPVSAATSTAGVQGKPLTLHNRFRRYQAEFKGLMEEGDVWRKDLVALESDVRAAALSRKDALVAARQAHLCGSAELTKQLIAARIYRHGAAMEVMALYMTLEIESMIKDAQVSATGVAVGGEESKEEPSHTDSDPLAAPPVSAAAKEAVDARLQELAVQRQSLVADAEALRSKFSELGKSAAVAEQSKKLEADVTVFVQACTALMQNADADAASALRNMLAEVTQLARQGPELAESELTPKARRLAQLLAQSTSARFAEQSTPRKSVQESDDVEEEPSKGVEEEGVRTSTLARRGHDLEIRFKQLMADADIWRTNLGKIDQPEVQAAAVKQTEKLVEARKAFQQSCAELCADMALVRAYRWNLLVSRMSKDVQERIPDLEHEG